MAADDTSTCGAVGTDPVDGDVSSLVKVSHQLRTLSKLKYWLRSRATFLVRFLAMMGSIFSASLPTRSMLPDAVHWRMPSINRMQVCIRQSFSPMLL